MKGFGFLILIALVYILLLFFVQDAVAAGTRNESAEETNEIHNPNPLVQMFPDLDSNTAAVLDTLYGSYNGDEQCTRKAFCTLGNSVRSMPGRDLLFLFMGGYVPVEYSLYYEIFRNAAMYGQNCEVYVCILPDPTKVPPTAQSPAQNAKPKSQPRKSN